MDEESDRLGVSPPPPPSLHDTGQPWHGREGLIAATRRRPGGAWSRGRWAMYRVPCVLGDAACDLSSTTIPQLLTFRCSPSPFLLAFS